jgi:DNA-binding IscR family transcriptional regulator
MKSLNSRFVLALHILTYLQVHGGRPVTSAEMARSVNTDPTFIRRSRQTLVRAGLVVQRGRGPNSGALLAIPADRITLNVVYDAVSGGGDDLTTHPDPDTSDVVGRNLQPVLSQVAQKVAAAVWTKLSHTTVASVAAEVANREKRGRG